MTQQTAQPGAWTGRQNKRSGDTWIKVREVLGRAVAYLLLTVGGLVLLVPFLWTFSTSLKASGAALSWPPQFIPRPVVFRNYVDLFVLAPFGHWLLNSMLVTALSVLGAILSATMVGFAFSRLRFPGRDAMFMLCVSTMMLPFIVTMIPSFILFRILGWIDTFGPLVVGSWLGPAFYIFLSRQFMRGLPMDYDEAARMDGATSWRIWASVILPNSGAVIATIGILSFRASWNNFMGPLIYLNTTEKFTLAVGLRTFRSYTSTNWALLMAGSVVMIMPVLILFFSLQRYFLRGMQFSGVTGR